MIPQVETTVVPAPWPADAVVPLSGFPAGPLRLAGGHVVVHLPASVIEGQVAAWVCIDGPSRARVAFLDAPAAEVHGALLLEHEAACRELRSCLAEGDYPGWRGRLAIDFCDMLRIKAERVRANEPPEGARVFIAELVHVGDLAQGERVAFPTLMPYCWPVGLVTRHD